MTEAKPSTGARADCTHCGSVDLDAAPAIPCRTNSPMKEHELTGAFVGFAGALSDLQEAVCVSIFTSVTRTGTSSGMACFPSGIS